MKSNSLAKATLGRLPDYLQYLQCIDKEQFISATAIARALSLGEVQVRKDLSQVCNSGRPRIGYQVEELTSSIQIALGYNNLTKAVVVGAGKLGRALFNYNGFNEYGIEIVAAFDLIKTENSDLNKVLLTMNEFDSFCKNNNVKIGIITVNENSAQDICDIMVKNKLKAIWNFTKKNLSVPKDVIVKNENLALSIAHLNNQLVNNF